MPSILNLPNEVLYKIVLKAKEDAVNIAKTYRRMRPFGEVRRILRGSVEVITITRTARTRTKQIRL